MRILHFVEHFSKPTETFIKRYVEKCMQFSEVAIAAFEFYDVPDDVAENVVLYSIDNPEFSKKKLSGLKRYVIEKATGKKIWYKQFNEAIEEFRPDIIHCHFGPMGIELTKFTEKYHLKCPFVTTIYAFDITMLPLINELYRRDLLPLWQATTAVFAEGPALSKKIFKYGCPPQKCLFNPLIIPINDYPQKTHYRSLTDPIKFLFLGRFIEKKGFHIFLKAVAQLVDQIPAFSIDIVGAGPMQTVFEELIATLSLNTQVKWQGLVKHPDVIPMLKDYDFLAHSSLTAENGDDEGGSATIIIEAQAVGLPVITTRHADIPYVMGYHDFLAEENDVDSLKAAIIKIVNCENITHYIKLGREKVIADHNLNNNRIYEHNLMQVLNSCSA